jgi:beta-glucosidase
LQVTPLNQQNKGEINVSVNVTNTGSRKGDEVVQLYVRDKVSSVITYDSQLRGFERVPLNPGETKTVTFTLKPEDFELLDKNMNWVVEPGKFEIMIGASSEDIKLKQEIELLN